MDALQREMTVDEFAWAIVILTEKCERLPRMDPDRHDLEAVLSHLIVRVREAGVGDKVRARIREVREEGRTGE